MSNEFLYLLRKLSDYNYEVEKETCNDAIKEYAEDYELIDFPDTAVAIITGTNGKGSCVAALENIVLEQGYKVASFSTPFFFKANEQYHINGKPVSDEKLLAALKFVMGNAKNYSLSKFEITTLIAFYLFKQEKFDLIILEVGMGGTNDAVNVIEPDISIISSIDLDHCRHLGNTREEIALHKAGICRTNKPAICGDANPPQTLRKYVKDNHIAMRYINDDFKIEQHPESWDFQSENCTLKGLPYPKIQLSNAASVLMALDVLRETLPVSESAIKKAFQKLHVPGRQQVVSTPITQIFDVAHNPASVKKLASSIKPHKGKTHAVFSMLGDKAISKSVAHMKEHVDHWHIAPLDNKRAATLDQIIEALKENNIHEFHIYESVKDAHQSSLEKSEKDDRVIVFGSFKAVAEVLPE